MRAKTAWVGAEGWVAAFRVSGSHRLIYGGEIHLKEEGAQAVGCHDPHVRCPLFMPTIKTISMIIESWKWSTDLSKQGALRMEKGSRRGKKKKKRTLQPSLLASRGADPATFENLITSSVLV